MAGAKLVTDQVLAGSAKAGLVRLSVAPADGSLPIAVGENDPILSRDHVISDVTGLQDELDTLSAHGHSVFTVSVAGFVPSPETATGRFLKDDGTWAAIIGGGGAHAASHLPGGGDTIPTASGTQAGLLSAADWTTFNGGSFPGFGTTAGSACEGNDARLSDARPASDVPEWAKGATKPSYTYSEVGACSTTDARLSDARPASDVSAWAKAATKPEYTAGEVGAQAALNGTGFVRIAGTTITYDNSTYLTSNQTITLSGDASGSGTTAINVSIGTFAGSARGLVPASVGDTTDFLRADGAWAEPPSGGSAVDENGVMHIPVGTPPSAGISGEIQLYADYAPARLVPIMTGPALPAGYVASAQENYGAYYAWKLFDGITSNNVDTWCSNGSPLPLWVQIQIPVARVAVAYEITMELDYPLRQLDSWTIRGSNDGSTWTDIHTITGQKDLWGANLGANMLPRLFSMPNTTAYSYYRMVILTNAGNQYTNFREWKLLWADPSGPLVLKIRDNLGNIKTFQAS